MTDETNWAVARVDAIMDATDYALPDNVSKAIASALATARAEGWAEGREAAAKEAEYYGRTVLAGRIFADRIAGLIRALRRP